jgi:hypothetical protein
MEQLTKLRSRLYKLLLNNHLIHWQRTLCKEQGVFELNQLEEQQAQSIIDKVQRHVKNRKAHHTKP